MADFNKCWYEKVCSNRTDTCKSNCIRYLEMYHLLKESNLPVSKWTPVPLTPDVCDVDAFYDLAYIKDEIVNFVNKGSNLYIYSYRTGNGKTTWAIKILLKYFNDIWAGNGFRRRAVFIHVPSFLTQLKNFNAISSDFERLKGDLSNVDLVVWDDVAGTDLTAYDITQLLIYIDQRTLNDKSNIFTGNLNRDDLARSLGIRIASRVWNNSTRIELKGLDKRM